MLLKAKSHVYEKELTLKATSIITKFISQSKVFKTAIFINKMSHTEKKGGRRSENSKNVGFIL